MALTFDLLVVSLGTQLVTIVCVNQKRKNEEFTVFSKDFSRYFECFALSILSVRHLLLVKLRIMNRRSLRGKMMIAIPLYY